jgi:hypothetical protein
MPSKVHTRRQLFAYEHAPGEGAVQFEGQEFDKFARQLDQRLQGLVDRWEPLAAPVDRLPQPEWRDR